MSAAADLSASPTIGVSPPRRPGAARRGVRLVAASCAAALLSGCSGTTYCANQYRGGCAEGPAPAIATTAPAIATAAPAPAIAAAPAGMPAPITTAPAVPLGDPSRFARVDDEQCRSYGLKFGTHDYADCRIRLSAQHRGLDPNIGAPPGSR